MKNNYVKKLLVILVLLINCYPIFSQTSGDDLVKYWFYRNRLNRYFSVPGGKSGESQIVCVRNKIFTGSDLLSTGQDPFDTTYKDVDYGQHTTFQGLYIGVLATEYCMFYANGQTNVEERT